MRPFKIYKFLCKKYRRKDRPLLKYYRRQVVNTTEKARYHFLLVYCDQGRLLPQKQIMDTAFSYDYNRLIFEKQILTPLSPIRRNYLKIIINNCPVVLLRQTEESIGYKQGCEGGYFLTAFASTPIASASASKNRENDH